MGIIIIHTLLPAPIRVCFDVARDIGIHLRSASHTREIVVSGKQEGLCELDDIITWEATHMGVRQQLTVQITAMEPPFFFEDRMLKGAFGSMTHQHIFRQVDQGTMMEDVFSYTVPLGWAGQIFDKLVLRSYMMRFLLKRNKLIREAVIVQSVAP
jgi:ligand-binding SRPBCC domain-containing protein